MLDASRSWSRSGTIARYEWTFCDGSTASGPEIERTYDRARRVQRDPQGHRRPGECRLRLRHRAGARSRATPNRLLRRSTRPMRRPWASTRRPGHVQGADLRHHRRKRDLGLRRRQSRGGNASRTATSTSHAPDGYAVDDPPLSQAGRLPGPRRAPTAKGGRRPGGSSCRFSRRRSDESVSSHPA